MAQFRQKPGKPLANGYCVGVITLAQAGPHIPGDVCNASSFNYPVLYREYPDLQPAALVRDDSATQDMVREAASDMAASGVAGVAGNCSWLLRHRDEIARKAGVPVCASSLQWLPLVGRLIGRDAIAVLTADPQCLSADLLAKAGYAGRNEIIPVSLDRCPAYSQYLMTPGGALDSGKLQSELVELALQVQRDHPATGAVLLECPLLPPYAAAIRDATQLPVFDQVGLIDLLQSATHRRDFTGYY